MDGQEDEDAKSEPYEVPVWNLNITQFKRVSEELAPQGWWYVWTSAWDGEKGIVLADSMVLALVFLRMITLPN